MYRIISFFFLVLCLFPVEFPSQNIWEWPLQLCWEIADVTPSTLVGASDNEKTIILLRKNNLLQANTADGKFLWLKEIVNETIWQINADTDRIYLVTKTENQIGVYSISQTTGLTIWKRVLENSGGEKIFFTPTKRFLLIYNRQGAPVLFDKEDGALINDSTSKIVRIESKQLDDEIINFPIAPRKVAAYSVNRQQIIHESEIPLAVNRLKTAEPQNWLISDSKGQLALFAKNKLVWKIQVGAEVVDFVWDKSGVSIVSNDNYLYQLSKEKGAILWKKRFSGRLEIQFDARNNVIFVVDSNYGILSIINPANGKLLNQIVLPNNLLIIGQPLIILNQVILSTSRGIKAFSHVCN